MSITNITATPRSPGALMLGQIPSSILLGVASLICSLRVFPAVDCFLNAVVCDLDSLAYGGRVLTWNGLALTVTLILIIIFCPLL